MRLCLPGVLLVLAQAAFGVGPEGTRWVSIDKVLDGDTLRLKDGRRVRLLGIDAPELEARPTMAVAYGREAAAFVRGRIGGNKVGLSFEGRREDSFGRLLAHVWLEDGTLLERELVARGLAKVYLKEVFSYKAEFLKLQEKARKAKLGLWRKSN